MQPIHILLAIIANCGWAFNFIAGKIGSETFQPLLFTSLRFLFLLILMLPWLRPAPGHMKPLLRLAFLMGIGHFSMMFIGINAGANIASVAITTQLYVPFSALLAALFLKEHIHSKKIVACSIAFLGVLIIGFDPIVFNHLDAVFWVMGAAFIMAVSTILMRQFPNLGVFRLQAWIALTAFPSLLLLSFIFESDQLHLLTNSQLPAFWSPLYSAIGASIIGHGIVYYLLARYPVSTVTPLTLLTPVLASLFGIWWFGDQIGWKLLFGGIMTLIGVLIITLN